MPESTQEQIEETKMLLSIRAASGDADAQYHLFILLYAEAMEKYDADLFNEAESYLVKSAKSGCLDALEALDDQKIRRYSFEQRVARNDAK